MMTVSSILFPTNCKPADAKAFEYALAVAKKLNAQIEVLYVCELDVGLVVSGILRYQLAQEQKKSAALILEKWLETFDFGAITVNAQVELGFAKETIATYANKHQDIELIVMGARNNHGFAKMIAGTVISTTIENAACPVLLIPKGIVFQSIKNIAYVTPEMAGELPIHPPTQLKNIVDVFDAQLYVTHLKGTSLEPIEGAEYVLLDDYAEALQAFIYNANLHLLVTLTSVRSTFQKILQYSKAQKMAFETLIPLLVLKKR